MWFLIILNLFTFVEIGVLNTGLKLFKLQSLNIQKWLDVTRTNTNLETQKLLMIYQMLT